jgi:FdrA protein
VQKARSLASAEGRDLAVIASITGTEQDPQRLSRQWQALEEARVILCASNAAAARLAVEVVK